MKNLITDMQQFNEVPNTQELEEKLQKYVYGHSIVSIVPVSDEQLEFILDNNVVISVNSHEGCGGCYNGWFRYDKIITTGIKGNVITKVEVESEGDYEESTFTINIYSYDKRIVSTAFNGVDNGYYGVGINVHCHSLDINR